MLILTYFHPVLGPDILLTEPEDILDNINPNHLTEIKNLLDTADPGFFTHFFSTDLRTVNMVFSLPSPWARGGEEIAMISKIIQESDPNLELYETQFIEFITKIKSEISDVYMVFYFRKPPKKALRDEIKQKLEQISYFFSDLYKSLKLIPVDTFGALIPLNTILKEQTIHIPSRFIHELGKDLDGTEKNFFVVNQYRDKKFKIELIPVKCQKIIKISLILGNTLNLKVVQKISNIFSQNKLIIIYTSGICIQSGGNCIYEVYLDADAISDVDQLVNQLNRISEVNNIKIRNIEL
ncbi:MAG: hypothetical protein JW776_15115 [Candidatus Lokiarchaeota archaeon]|nr:hypothetical protein [Candidatus Lokiarchaeota archaeon]